MFQYQKQKTRGGERRGNTPPSSWPSDATWVLVAAMKTHYNNNEAQHICPLPSDKGVNISSMSAHPAPSQVLLKRHTHWIAQSQEGKNAAGKEGTHTHWLQDQVKLPAGVVFCFLFLSIMINCFGLPLNNYHQWRENSPCWTQLYVLLHHFILEGTERSQIFK